MPEAVMPDAAAVLLLTRQVNEFTHAHYTCEEVAQMDPVIFELVAALQRGLNPESESP